MYMNDILCTYTIYYIQKRKNYYNISDAYTLHIIKDSQL